MNDDLFKEFLDILQNGFHANLNEFQLMR